MTERKPPKPKSLCSHDDCRATWAQHADGKCPGRPDRDYRRTPPSSPLRVSTSLSAAEVNVAHEVVTGLLAGKDLRQVVRNPTFALLVRKVSSMRATLAERKAGTAS